MKKRKLLAGVPLVGILVVLALPALAQENCTIFYDHSGNIPGSYDYARFFEDGQFVVEVETNGEDIFVNPEGFDAGSSWDKVKKCNRPDTTTTTVPETTTTLPETTTTVGETTTTVAETTTTAAETTTTVGETTTTAGVTTTQPPELPFTGIDRGALIALGSSALTLGALLVFGVKREEEA